MLDQLRHSTAADHNLKGKVRKTRMMQTRISMNLWISKQIEIGDIFCLSCCNYYVVGWKEYRINKIFPLELEKFNVCKQKAPFLPPGIFWLASPSYFSLYGIIKRWLICLLSWVVNLLDFRSLWKRNCILKWLMYLIYEHFWPVSYCVWYTLSAFWKRNSIFAYVDMVNHLCWYNQRLNDGSFAAP